MSSAFEIYSTTSPVIVFRTTPNPFTLEDCPGARIYTPHLERSTLTAYIGYGLTRVDKEGSPLVQSTPSRSNTANLYQAATDLHNTVGRYSGLNAT